MLSKLGIRTVRGSLPSEAEEAWQKTKDGKCIDGFIPIVFLDKQLDSSELRSWLDKQAIRRRNLI
jgi:hypothetical protein